MNRSTCQICQKKRYQDRMVLVNLKSLKNGKPEWECKECRDQSQIELPLKQANEEPTDNLLLFNGILMDGENCGYCHLAPKGVQLCDCCKERILNSGDFDKASRLNLYEYRYNVTEAQWSHYNKNPLRSTSTSSADNEARHSYTQRAYRLKMELLEKAIKELRV